jgi:hypothetical protein
MAITHLIDAGRGLRRTPARGLGVATAALLAASLLGGCDSGNDRPAAAAPAEAQSQQAPLRTMRVEKRYTDDDGNRFTIELAIGPLAKDADDVCAQLAPPDAYSHSMKITVKSDAAKTKKARVPRLAVKDNAITFTSRDSSGPACNTVISTTNKTVLRGDKSKQFDALISRRSREDGDVVMTVWPNGKPQKELFRIPVRSLP